jgi:hypothetical protein
VTAVVLTLGEVGTEDALASLRRQTLPPHEVVLVRGVSPFHQAVNSGARQVATPFFVQVDADMILDPDCLAELRRLVEEDSGIVVGQLRDALIGRVVGIKLFRTAPFREVLMADTISPDTDLGRALARGGWKTVYAGRPPQHDPEAWRTYGEHRPDYGPDYTYRKYLMEGRRYRYRRNPDGIRWHFGRLEASRHASAVIAQVALANGIFLESEQDLLGRLETDAAFAGLVGFLAAPGDAGPEATASLPLAGSLQESFRGYYERGRSLFRAGAFASFDKLLGSLSGCHKSEAALVAKVGLCRGLLEPDREPRMLAADFRVLEEFLAATPRDGALRGFVARLGRWFRRRSSAS